MDRLQEIIQNLSTNGSFKIRSAANPILWMVGSIGAIVVGSMFTQPPNWVYVALISLFGLTVLTALGIIIFMVAMRPDDLRSEEYLLEQKRISMYYDASNSTDPVPSIDLEARPDPKKIETDASTE